MQQCLDCCERLLQNEMEAANTDSRRCFSTELLREFTIGMENAETVVKEMREAFYVLKEQQLSE